MTRNRLIDGTASAILVIAVAVAGQAAWSVWQIRQANRTIDALGSGHDIAVAPDEPGPLLVARGDYLLQHRRPEDAQAVADHMASGPDQTDRAALLYELGNAMLRQALTHYLAQPVKLTAPLIRFAKAEYREALAIDPDNWDARFNLDVATALVRERDFREPNIGQDMARDRAYRPDIPGAPDGLP